MRGQNLNFIFRCRDKLKRACYKNVFTRFANRSMTEGREGGRKRGMEGGSLKGSSIFPLCRYNELTQVDPSEALRYLKTKLAECVNHNNPEHSQEVAMIAMHRAHTHTQLHVQGIRKHIQCTLIFLFCSFVH